MAVAKVQQLAGDDNATPGVETFGSTPTEGNLLVVIAHQRGADQTPTISGTGWTQRVHEPIQISDGTFRQELFVWTKDAGAAEPTEITVTPSPAGELFILYLQEFSGVSDANWEEYAFSHNNETSSTSSDNDHTSGTTTSLASGEYFLLSAFCVKGNPAAVCTDYVVTGWTPDNGDHTTKSNNGQLIGTAWSEDTYSGTQQITGTYTQASFTNRGIGHALLVWSIPSAASIIPQAMHHYTNNLG